MNKDAPLVSVVVLCYRNFRYIYDAIASILVQEYPNIELIVSDDGSKNFPEQEIRQYIEKHKRGNIKNVILNQNKQNVGTVKHLNIVMRLASGAFKMSLSGDDMIDSPTVLSTYVRKLSARPDADILMAQTAMYDEAMEEVLYYFVQPHIRDLLLYDQQSDKLYNELVQHAYLPSVSTFFRAEFFVKYGFFDESYDLVEDWSLHLRLAREHIPIVYIDFVSIRHRSGGISHGNTTGTNSTYFRYLKDLTETYQNAVAPYSKQIEPKIWRNIQYRHKKDRAWIELQAKYKPMGTPGMILYILRHPATCLSELLPYYYHGAYGKQWNFILLSILILMICPWVGQAFGIGCHALFQMSSVAVAIAVSNFFYGLGCFMFGLGIAMLLVYVLASTYCLVTEYMQIYF